MPRRARLWTPHPLYLRLGKNRKERQQAWTKLVKETLDIEVFYNRQRRHSHLGGVSPEAYEQASL